MKNSMLAAVCILILGLGISGCGQKPKQQTTVPAAKEQAEAQKPAIKLTGLGGIKYSVKNIPENTVNYVKTKSEYKELYTDKKFAIYYVGADCPYAQTFIDTVEPLKNSTEYSDKYNFYPQQAAGLKEFSSLEEAQADVDFSNMCNEFCIVNPAKNQIFSIDGIGSEEAAKLGSIFEQLKDW